MTRTWKIALLGGLLAVAGVAVADPPDFVRAALQRPVGASGVVVVPDRYLRPWDPVTVFFPADVGPREGGPEDDPRRHATLSPDHPGAWTWIDARTLQFRPAEPWPALARYTVQAGGRTAELASLVSPPVASIPADHAEDLAPVEAVTLTFPEPVDPDALAKMVRFELRPLPGLGGSDARWLGADDFEVKAVEAPPGEGDGAVVADTGHAAVGWVPEGHRYVLALDTPIPLGTRAVLHFRLSPGDDVAADAPARLSFSTAEPFRVARAGCGGEQVPVTPSGTRYDADQALSCAGARTVAIDFSARPADLGPVEARNLVRFTPAVEDLAFEVDGRRLTISGRFAAETAYEVRLAPTALRDVDGRPLQMTGESAVWVAFPAREPYLRWGATQGLAERHGPQTVPLEGRGHDRVDLRLWRVDPLDPDFWPWPAGGVTLDEATPPPGPGEEPPHGELGERSDPARVAQRVAMLGSPAWSGIVGLPLRADGAAATFGLDLSDALARAGGKGAAGTYLVGVRALDTRTTRTLLRLQVTDLALTTVEEADAVRFLVTSLDTGRPVSGAEVRLEGRREGGWGTLVSGRTGADGTWTWTPPAPGEREPASLGRVVVAKGDDTLALAPDQVRMRYADNHWGQQGDGWLSWAFQPGAARGPVAETLCHVFTERPVYRPEEEVHVEGWLRRREKGTLTPLALAGRVEVAGPGALTWSFPVETSADTGGFYTKFADAKLPSGTYRATFRGEKQGQKDAAICGTTFQMEAYRVPSFETVLTAPERAPLDVPFEVGLVASYYAGGRVAGRPVRWRVTQFPHTWAPTKKEGWYFSSDGRWSGAARFDATPRWEQEGETDADGGAHIVLDPTLEPTAQPRAYVVEATVTGDDDQTVTATKRVVALPAFTLGLEVPRYLETATTIPVEVQALGPDGKPLAGKDVTVRLLRREWHSVLQASDFSEGKARYVTDVVDEKAEERAVRTTAEPTKLTLPIDRAGVWVVEVEGHDKLGRLQRVAVDLYAGGGEPVAWQKPAAGVFTVQSDRERYAPGQSATLVLQSPFQQARALVVVEAPEGNEYRWIDVRGGTATYTLPIRSTWAPRVPVHVVLMRGRVEDGGPTGASATDQGKPTTLASTAWLAVEPVDNQVKVTVESPARAKPGETVPVTIRLRKPDGKPLAGEVALWLVDAAVLALGTEQRLDPLPDYVTPVRSHLWVRDTRGLGFGRVPFAELPGGDGGEAEEEEPLEKATVRRDLKAVPYYAPALKVGPDGVLTVKVKLPDNLTTFKIRAKAASGPDRFGAGTGEIAVRLPVLVQAALPRFVRPGDTFSVGALARVVEGEGGPGAMSVEAKGLALEGGGKRDVTLSKATPTPLRVPATVPTPERGPDGKPTRESVTVKLAVARKSDGAADAFEATLPIRDDRPEVVLRQIAELAPSGSATVPALPEAARPGTVRRALLATDRMALARMAGALDVLVHHPAGSTEERIARARSFLALGALRRTLGLQGGEAEVDRAVADTLAWLPGTVDAAGLVAAYPGSEGRVALTAWAAHFVLEAKEAGHAVDPALLDGLLDTLAKSLRSDFGRFLAGEAYVERGMALEALAAAGRFDRAYFAELARTATFRDAEGVAGIALAGARSGQADAATVGRLVQTLSDGLIVRLWQGREVYGGLQAQRPRNGLILPSETRTVASIARALARAAPDHPRLALLEDALTTLGQDDGWGNVNADAAALLALADRVRTARPATPWRVEVAQEGKTVPMAPGDGVVALASLASGAAATAKVVAGGPVLLRVDTRYVPAQVGAEVAPAAQGFVVSRELLRIRREGPADRFEIAPGVAVKVDVGDVVEDHVRVVNPVDRNYVVVEIPLPAGLELLNPRLATAPPEARPSHPDTRAATWSDWRDDAVVHHWETLPKGTYDLYVRARATVAGSFVQPAAGARATYDPAAWGRSAGARVVVEEKGR